MLLHVNVLVLKLIFFRLVNYAQFDLELLLALGCAHSAFVVVFDDALILGLVSAVVFPFAAAISVDLVAPLLVLTARIQYYSLNFSTALLFDATLDFGDGVLASVGDWPEKWLLTGKASFCSCPQQAEVAAEVVAV
jgi:hypothetical protein